LHVTLRIPNADRVRIVLVVGLRDERQAATGFEALVL
jgi:hypothetical protein